jgi:hypothetical protein
VLRDKICEQRKSGKIFKISCRSFKDPVSAITVQRIYYQERKEESLDKRS